MKLLTILTMLAIGVTACSSQPNVKEYPKSANAKEEIYNLQTAIESSQKDNTNILAPESFKEAKDSLSDAQNLEKDGKSNERVLKEVALGRAYLEQAHANAKRSETKLQDVIAAREAAIAANAEQLLPAQFKKFDDKVSKETASLEKDDSNDIKEKRYELIAGYLDLELAAIKMSHLGESRRLIDTSVGNGARDLTPTTLNVANKRYQDADLFITQNRHSRAEIEVKAAAVLAAAQKLETTTNTARGITKSTPEDMALRIQAEEEKMNATQRALSEEQDANVALAASNSQLARDKRLDAMYEKARAKFTPEEAEVYKQGKNLVIRMKGLEFPKAQAMIRGENFVLLKKVDDVIASFDNSKVLVEGHTDSTGGKAINQKLSDQRAIAVKQYLEANTANKEVDFDSKGFGFEKPIASNKSPEGRAQNRRVDVIIQPAQL